MIFAETTLRAPGFGMCLPPTRAYLCTLVKEGALMSFSLYIFFKRVKESPQKPTTVSLNFNVTILNTDFVSAEITH